jgi:hypothetical protein
MHLFVRIFRWADGELRLKGGYCWESAFTTLTLLGTPQERSNWAELPQSADRP